jgi:hypothetical protein
MDLACPSPAHVRSQLAPPPQLTEHSPVQVMWHVDFGPQLTLPLLPTVRVQVEPSAQLALQDSPQVPLQVAWLAHWREQLFCSQALPLRSQVELAAQLQLVPVHEGGSPAASLPQWASVRTKERAPRNRKIFMQVRIDHWGPRCSPQSRPREVRAIPVGSARARARGVTEGRRRCGRSVGPFW